MLRKIKSKVKKYIQNMHKFSRLNPNDIQLITSATTQIAQKQIFQHYLNLKNNNKTLPNFEDTGFRVFSQVDEDGLLLYIFSLIGFKNHKLVDMAFGSPYGANSTNLLVNWGFHGLLAEGDEKHVAITDEFFNTNSDTKIFPPVIINEWITVENVNKIIINHGFNGEIDLFSLDIDGMDYWIWKSLDAILPRVVIVEYQDIWGPDKAMTVPYNPHFNRFEIHEDFFGASLPAFVSLAKKKGYRLVGCNKYGYNAFFVRNDIGEDLLAEISVEKCFKHLKVQDGIKKRLPSVLNLPWEEVN